ncbi:MAG: type II toxin-antitoxin system RelB/DinJ family antitoxin [Clostridiales bacterium]|nr:type II toxin-antitoxin system RelB/DinJ family antitoxin [Clostridiales bacterium]
MPNKPKQQKDMRRDTSNQFFSFRIKSPLRELFVDFCDECGITMTDAIFMLVKRTIKLREIPFKVEPLDTGSLLYSDENEVKTEQVTIRMSKEMMGQFTEVCDEIGISKSGLVKMYFKRCIYDRELPFFGK